jgi:hypothetical protein
MRTLSIEETNQVNGGTILAVILTCAAIYEAANIVYEFGKGVVEGYQANDSV